MRVVGEDYRLCGWRVRSDFPLPDLLPWIGSPSAPVDLHVELGPVEERLADQFYEGPILQLGADGTCRFAMEGVAVYRIAPDGRSIRVQPHLPEDFPALRTFLLGSVMAIACQRRGLLPLHACCVRLPTPSGDVAVAFSAPSGVGKSTLASAFIRRGYSILADDVALLAIDSQQRTWGMPTFPRVKLWRDALERFGYSADSLERVRQGMDKFSVALQPADFSDAAPLELAALYHVERVNDAQHAGLERVMGLAASIRFSQSIYQAPALMHAALDKAAHFALATRMAAGVKDHHVLRQLSGIEHLDGLISRIVAIHAGDKLPA